MYWEDPNHVYGTIPYIELHESNRTGYRDGLFYGFREFIVHWADRLNFLDMIAHITHPSANYLLPRDIQVVGWGPSHRTSWEISAGESSGAAGYPYAKLAVQYAPFALTPWELSADENTYILRIEQSDISGEFLQVPGHSYHWSSGGHEGTARLSEPVGIMVPSTEFQVVEQIVPNYHPSFHVPFIGMVNNDDFAGFSREKVLYLGTAQRRRGGPLVARPSHLVHKFRARDIEWNKAYRPGRGWTRVVDRSSMLGWGPYRFTDLEQVIVAPKPADP